MPPLESPPPQKPHLAFKALGNAVAPFQPRATLRLFLASRSALLPSLHHPAFSHYFWPISRVTPCTSLFLQLKLFDAQGSKACISHALSCHGNIWLHIRPVRGHPHCPKSQHQCPCPLQHITWYSSCSTGTCWLTSTLGGGGNGH